MSEKTARHKIEYPVPSDKVIDVAAINQRAANTIDTLLTAASDRIQTGTVGLGVLGYGDRTETLTVTFPKPFKSVPVVFMQSGNQRHNVAVWNVSATGFNWMVHNNTSAHAADTTLMWLAVGA